MPGQPFTSHSDFSRRNLARSLASALEPALPSSMAAQGSFLGSSLLSGGALRCSLLLSSLAGNLASSLLSDAALRQQPAERRRAPLQPSPHNSFIAASFWQHLLSGGALCCSLFRGSFASSLAVCCNSHPRQPPAQRRRALPQLSFQQCREEPLSQMRLSRPRSAWRRFAPPQSSPQRPREQPLSLPQLSRQAVLATQGIWC